MAESAAGHPLLEAVAPLLARLDAEVVEPAKLRKGDVPLVWEGETVAGVRLASADAPSGTSSAESSGAASGTESAGDLAALIDEVAAEIAGERGLPLADLSRADKQRAVRVLEERGAFAYRRSAETIAEAIGVSRFTVYNYLNRSR